jgi:NADH-quinone oxidoreductase subunit G
VLRVLGNLLGFADFEQVSSEEVRDTLRRLIEATAAPIAAQSTSLAINPAPDAMVTDLPMYQADAILRRATALQRTREARSLRQNYGSGGA